MKVAERTYQTLRRRLMVNYYEPGSFLREVSVAKDLKVSRTPVRTAFQRLIAEGLLTTAERRGAIVTGWRKSDTEDIFKLRIHLEGYAASLAASAIDDGQLNSLISTNERMRAAVSGDSENRIERIAEENKAFHEGILDATGQGYLGMFGRTLLHLPMVSGFFLYSQEEMEESIRQHEDIIAALEARNEKWAEAAMAAHLSRAMVRFKRHSDKETSEQLTYRNNE